MTTIEKPVLSDDRIEAQFADDPTERESERPKAKNAKVSVKELQDRIIELEVKLELAHPDQASKAYASLKNASLRNRDLGYFLREYEHAIHKIYQCIEKEGDNNGTRGDSLSEALAESRQLNKRVESYLYDGSQRPSEAERDDTKAPRGSRNTEQNDRELQEDRGEPAELHGENRQQSGYIENTNEAISSNTAAIRLLLAILTYTRSEAGIEATSKPEKQDAPTETFNAEMAASIIEELYQERDLDREYFQHTLEERDQRIDELEAEAQQSATADSIRQEDENHDTSVYNLHMRKVLRNKQLTSSEKLTAGEFVKRIIKEHPEDLHAPTIIPMGKVADSLGVSESTITRINAAMSEIGAWDAHTSNPEPNGNGDFSSHTTVTLKDIIDNPDSLVKEKVQGGPRQRRDKKTNEPLDSFGLDYARSREEVQFRALPGQPDDANIFSVIQAIKEDRFTIDPYLKNQANHIAALKKQDAFFLEDSEQGSDTHQLHTEEATPGASNSQKQDAFSDIYVDDIVEYETRLKYKHWCHMATSGPIEHLHAAAQRLGLKREWFQDKESGQHYDLTPGIREKALKAGAHAVSSVELITLCFPQIAAVMNDISPLKQDAPQQEPAQPEKPTRKCTCGCPDWTYQHNEWACKGCWTPAIDSEKLTYFYDTSRLQEALHELERAARCLVDPDEWVKNIMTEAGWDYYISIAAKQESA